MEIENMKPTLIHIFNDAIEVHYQNQLLFRYVYVPQNPLIESPRPYFHPMKTLAGNTVSLLRPHDHPWHCGFSMAIANLSDQNFWGGPTYKREEGYIQLDNNGRMQHTGWSDLTSDDLIHCVEQLQW